MNFYPLVGWASYQIPLNTVSGWIFIHGQFGETFFLFSGVENFWSTVERRREGKKASEPVNFSLWGSVWNLSCT